jgi:hypothetical protein
MKDCASYLCDILASEAACDPPFVDTSDIRQPARPAAVPKTPLAVASSPLDTATDLPPHERWAIGQFDTRRWHLYERRRKGYRCLREIRFEERPQSRLLLDELFRGKGSMDFMEAYVSIDKLRSDPDRGERLAHNGIDADKINNIRKRVKSAVSYLRKQLIANMDNGMFKIIEYEPGTGRYRLLVPIGASVRRVEGSRSGEYEFIPYPSGPQLTV